jgi:hypothetical protein
MSRSLIALFSIAALAACSTVSDLPPGYRLDAQDRHGVAVVSLTLSGKNLSRVSSFEYRLREVVPNEAASADVARTHRFGSARQHARWLSSSSAYGMAGTRAKAIVKDQSLDEPLDVKDESGSPIGRVAALRLPPGEYELYNWKIVEPSDYGEDVLAPRQSFGVRFRVEAARAVYIGNVNLNITEDDRYAVTVGDETKRDIPLLAKRVPFVSDTGIPFRPGRVTN